jgi:hypothetical protein
MVLQGDEAQVEARFGLFGDSANLNARWVHNLRETYHRLRNNFGRTRWYALVMMLKWRLVSVCLKIMLMLMQDTCKFCAKRTIGSEIVLDAPDGTPR